MSVKAELQAEERPGSASISAAAGQREVEVMVTLIQDLLKNTGLEEPILSLRCP